MTEREAQEHLDWVAWQATVEFLEYDGDDIDEAIRIADKKYSDAVEGVMAELADSTNEPRR